MNKMFIDTDYGQLCKYGQIVCGDVFLSEKIKNENRLVAILSDGLGSGIKANIMAKMTASMAMNFTIHDQPIERSAVSIRETLPIDPKRKIAFASFTIIDTEFDGKTRIIEYGNPQFLVFRKDKILGLKHILSKDKELRISEFVAQIEDRIILFSDGVSQSGIGRPEMPFGWDTDFMKDKISCILKKQNKISSCELQEIIVNLSAQNDALKPKDDITCAVMYFRDPRKLKVCSGPPFSKDKDKQMADTIRDFKGEKIICGGTTAQIVARELNRDLEVNLEHISPDLPPVSYIEGVDLVTEGILTLCKAVEFLENKSYNKIDKYNPAKQLVTKLLNHDTIYFLTG
ncbi:MAG: SpoIIE family protein phosphatase, partial [Bacteroidota bacterium]|nr:SpoIIE family protein phosphatase [Bacteroidota bacterium]